MKPFAYEWARLRTLRSTWVMSTISVLFSIGMGFLAIPIIKDNNDELGWMSSLTIAVPSVTALCCGLIGVFAVGHEYRYGTIRPTLTALPRRGAVMAAKVLVPALFALGLSVVCLIVNVALAWTLVHNELTTPAFSTTVFRVLIGAALYAVGFSIVGTGLTSMFRNQVGGIVLLIVLPLVIENSISVALLLIPWFNRIEEWSRYLPFSAGRAMYTPPSRLLTQTTFTPISPWVGGLVFFLFGALVCALGTARFIRNDA